MSIINNNKGEMEEEDEEERTSLMINDHQSLRLAENLTLPTVIVVNANVSCSHCQQRVSAVISKMKGLLDCVVDVSNRQVIIRGLLNSTINNKRKKQQTRCCNYLRFHSTAATTCQTSRRRFSFTFLLHFLRLRLSCFTS